MPPLKKMPPRKEPKETVVYPASKRKAPPFIPQRPSKVLRIATTESESSTAKSAGKKVTTAPAAARKPTKLVVVSDDDDDSEEDEEENGRVRVGKGAGSAEAGAEDSDSDDSDEELASDPLAARPKAKPPGKKPVPTKPKPSAAAATAKRKATPTREASPLSISSQASADAAAKSSPPSLPPVPSQSADTPQIPQNLIIRLLHEHFADKKTKIDKDAIQVLQKYIEVFVREAIARTALQKQEAVEKGDVGADDAGWLELEDLEKVAPGMMLDF